jgi:hypothetical protein
MKSALYSVMLGGIMKRPGLILISLAVAMLFVPAAGAADLFNNWNKDAVSNGPTAATVFTIAAPAHVTELATYHWNGGHGLPASPAVTITLKGAGGADFGPFTAVGSAGQGGVPNVNWTATVSFDLPAGTYTIVDSQPATWSQNAKSGGSGFAAVRGTTPGGGTPGEGPAPIRGFEYAVKFVCGRPVQPVVAPGEYFTAINVHNPSPQAVAFRKKIAVALPGEKAGRISQFFQAQLKSDEALEIDCQDILRHADESGFLKGFVVIQTPSELDVVAVYTAGHPAVETMKVEHVKPRLAALTVPPPSKTDSAYCPDGPPGAPVGNQYCCCNKPKPGGGYWPACNTSKGLDCYGNPSGPGIPASTYSTCTTGPFAPVEINSTQPAYCGQKP